MYSPVILALGSVLLVSVIPLLGIGFFLIREKLLRKSLLLFVSFSTGGLLGDVFLHMIPEMSEGTTFVRDLYIVLVGLVFSFVIEKLIHWRHCHVLPTDAEAHEHHHHPVGLMSLFGDGVHNFIDGVVIAGSFLVSIPVGVSTTLAVIFHEIPQEIGDFAVLLHSGFTRKKAILFNLLAGFAALLGALLFLLGQTYFQDLTVYLLPFAAGNFLYIAGADLIPELHKETGFKHVVTQLFFMILGIMVMFGLTLLE